jgi:hypothetical protein
MQPCIFLLLLYIVKKKGESVLPSIYVNYLYISGHQIASRYHLMI